MTYIRIYSVGVWNYAFIAARVLAPKLEFTPLEFETQYKPRFAGRPPIRIYSVGVWNQVEIYLLTASDWIRIYSVGVWNNLE